jgi:hypothetical protein
MIEQRFLALQAFKILLTREFSPFSSGDFTNLHRGRAFKSPILKPAAGGEARMASLGLFLGTF